MDLVNCWGSVDVRRTRLSGALGLGPACSLVIDVLGEAHTEDCKSMGSKKLQNENERILSSTT